MKNAENILTHATRPTELEHFPSGEIKSAVLHIENSTILDREILISNHLITGNQLTFEGDSFFIQLTPKRLTEINYLPLKDKKEEVRQIARRSKYIPHLQLTIERLDEPQRIPDHAVIWEFNNN